MREHGFRVFGAVVQQVVQRAPSAFASYVHSVGCEALPLRSGRRGRWFKSSRPDAKKSRDYRKLRLFSFLSAIRV